MHADEQHRMVLQIGADAAAVGDDRNAERLQLRRRADARAQQQRRRKNRAGGDDDFARAEFLFRAIDDRADADRARPSNNIFVTCALVATVRLARRRAAASR